MGKFKLKTSGTVSGDGINLVDKVVKINRCATVVKGGKRFSFSAMVVVGDGSGVVGHGFGKANEVPPAVEKAVKDAKKHLFRVPLRGQTLPHEARGTFGASQVQILPAAPGTGVIAGDAVRAVMEAAGVKDVLTKVYGSTNPVNVVKAAMDALGKMRTIAEVERLRGVKIA
jgi:small subunit ribosomal protein S5